MEYCPDGAEQKKTKQHSCSTRPVKARDVLTTTPLYCSLLFFASQHLIPIFHFPCSHSLSISSLSHTPFGYSPFLYLSLTVSPSLAPSLYLSLITSLAVFRSLALFLCVSLISLSLALPVVGYGCFLYVCLCLSFISFPRSLPLVAYRCLALSLASAPSTVTSPARIMDCSSTRAPSVTVV